MTLNRGVERVLMSGAGAAVFFALKLVYTRWVVKPHDRARPRRQRSRYAAAALIRLKLDWLRGYPMANTPAQWCVLPRPGSTPRAQPLTIDGTLMRRSSRALKELQRDHRESLVQLNADNPNWVERARRLLECLKPCASGTEGPPDPLAMLRSLGPARLVTLAERGLASQPALRPLILASCWIWAQNEAELKRALSWLAGKAQRPLAQLFELPPLEASADSPALAWLEVGLALTDLAVRLGPGPATALLTLLLSGGPELFYTAGVQGAVKAIANAMRARRRDIRLASPLDWPAPSGPSLLRLFAKVVMAVQQLPEKPARRAIQLAAMVWTPTAIEPWRNWWARYRKAQRAVEAELSPRYASLQREPLKSSVAMLVRLESNRPLILSSGRLWSSIARLVEKPEALYRSVSRALALLPDWDKPPLRARFLALWWYAIAYDEARFAAWSINAFREFIVACAPHQPEDWRRLLAPWQDWLNNKEPNYFYLTPDQDLTSEDAPIATGRILYGMLLQCYQMPPAMAELEKTLGGDLPTFAAAFERSGVDSISGARMLLALVQQFPKHTQVLSEVCWDSDVLQFAIFFSCGQPAAFARCVVMFETTNMCDELSSGLLKALRSSYVDSEAPALLMRCCEAGLSTEVVRALTSAETLQTMKVSPVLLEAPRLLAIAAETNAVASDDWRAHYPASLQPALLALAQVDDDAARSADKVLGRAFPRPQRLRRELANIEARLHKAGDNQRPHLLKRCENLRQQLAGVSRDAKRQEHHREKLSALVDRRTLARWQHEMKQRIEDNVHRAMALAGLPSVPPWFWQPPCSRLLQHLMAASHGFWKLAQRLLVARAGDGPWDLRDARANQQFVTRMRARGIKMEPWLDGIAPLEVDTPRGMLSLQLEPDPLEVMMMGAHFQTCLSPDSFNFFSAIANAADINKRVVYARDSRGGVVGRCLLALSDLGRLVAFHPYCHDGRIDMAALVSRFCQQLIRRMGNRLGLHDNIPRLLANDWYNDGPHAIDGAQDPLSEGAEFERGLHDLPADELLGYIAAQRPRLEINSRTLTLLLALPIVVKRPELMVPLVEVVRRAPVTSAQKAEVAVRAIAAGALNEGRSLLLKEVVPKMERLARSGVSLSVEALHAVVDLGACSLVLRCLRLTRPRDVGSWAEEATTRQLIAVRAHAGLHRRKLAIRLAEQLLAKGPERSLAQRAKLVLNELQASSRRE